MKEAKAAEESESTRSHGNGRQLPQMQIMMSPSTYNSAPFFQTKNVVVTFLWYSGGRIVVTFWDPRRVLAGNGALKVRVETFRRMMSC